MNKATFVAANLPIRYYRYFAILTILAGSLCEKIGHEVRRMTTTEEFTEISTVNVTSADANETFSITFKKGDHFPTIIFPLGDIGLWLFPVLFTIYMLLCLTVVCDFFLVPCIHLLSTRLEWKLDIAGATIMAAASSAPEMFVNILATFLTKSDVGVGTVLGTGLYALLLVPAFCILLNANKILKTDYWPIMRDSVAYFVSMVTLVIILMDSIIFWYEAVVLILIYFMYLIVLYFSDTLSFKFESCITNLRRKKNAAGRLIDPLLPLLPKPGRLPVSMSVEDVFNVLEDHTPEFCTIIRWPKDRGLKAKLEWILMWPIITILRLTIPTFWKAKYPQLCILTFTMCVAWIGVLCYGISWMIYIIGNTFSLPETVMGLTLIAAVMSIPETITGVIVAKQGCGTMALCNALGSNTFAILICLGVPWLINILVFSQPDQPYMVINSGGLEYNAILVAVALIVFLLLFAFNRFRLREKSGWLLVLLYLIFVSGGVYTEFQFFWRSKN